MNKKGFTLIELLAVIVILAIIALITAPIILGVIENARKDSAKDKAWGTINAVKIAYTQDQTKDSSYKIGDPVTFNNKKASVGTTEVKASGELPESGTVTIRNDGSIIAVGLKFKDYTCSTVKSETDNTIDPNNMVCVKGDSQVPTSNIVYRYTEDGLRTGYSIETVETTTDPTTLGKKYYLKHEINSENKITASYVCFVTDTEHCIQGGDGGAAYETNKTLLQSQEQWFNNNGGNCSFNGSFSLCNGGDLNNILASSNGTVSATDSSSVQCSVNSDGYSGCGK